MSRKYTYDYYVVRVPSYLSHDTSYLENQAILEAKERTRLYCVPAVWTAIQIDGDTRNWMLTFKVCRKRYNTKGK